MDPLNQLNSHPVDIILCLAVWIIRSACGHYKLVKDLRNTNGIGINSTFHHVVNF